MTKHRFIILILILLMTLVGCASEEEPTVNFESLPVGDVANGERLYYERINGQPKCSDCHTVDGASGVGPTLLGIKEIAGQRVEGLSAEEYILQSIDRPWAYLVEGYANQMPARYSHTLTAQDTADLIAFVLTH